MPRSTDDISHETALAALDWLVAMGATEATLDDSLDRFDMARPDPADAARAAAPVQPLQAPTTDAPPTGPRPIAPRPPKAAAGAGAEVAEKAAQAVTSLDALKAAINAFDGGHIQRAAKHMVFADGAEDAPLMLIGEAPDADDDRTGIPFSGVSGQLLDRMLAAINHTRSKNAYLAYTVPWRTLKTPDQALVNQSLPFLRKHIALKKPRLVVCLGAVPARALFETDQGISNLRGRWRDMTFGGHSVAVVATHNPRHLLRQPQLKGDAWKDLLAIKAKLNALSEETNEQ